MVINHKKAIEYPLSPVPLSITTAEGGICTTSKSKLLDITNATLTVPPNSPNIQAAFVEVFGDITQRVLSNRSSS